MKQHNFDYAGAAELYTYNQRRGGPRSMAFRRFETAANAIRYSIETLPRARLPGTLLEVSERRYDHTEIRELYDSSAYPLRRQFREADDAEKAEL